MTRLQRPAEAVAKMLSGGAFLWLPTGARPLALPSTVGAVVATSGSTGTDKKVVLSRESLVAAAAASRMALGSDLTWHLVLPHRYVAGLMVLVRSLISERQPILSPPDLSELRPAGEGDAVSIVGTQLFRALQDPALTRILAEFDTVLVGGAALAPELRSRALDAGLRLKETYGMSETCGGVVWDGVALPGIHVKIHDDARAPHGFGRIALGGPTLCDGYLEESGRIRPATREGWLMTEDWGRVHQRRLAIGGRLDDVVITGGVNVDLGAVRRAASALDQETAVLAVDDPQWGARIIIFARGGSLEMWRDQLAQQLGRTALPRQVIHISALPRTAGGKPDTQALLALVPQ